MSSVKQSIDDLSDLDYPILDFQDISEGRVQLRQIDEDNILGNYQFEFLGQIDLNLFSIGTQQVPMEEDLPHSIGSESTSIETSQPQNRNQKRRAHLYRPRLKKGQRSRLQEDFSGYWTKNFLPAGKNPHFNFLAKVLGIEYIENDPVLSAIRKKTGITMEDYIFLYKIEELKEVWKRFFAQRVLYRELMISRAEGKSKEVFVKLLYRFQEAFITGEFDHIA